MPRAKTKNELLINATNQFGRMWDIINGLSIEDTNKLFNFEDRDKNIRDILIHLHEWHNLLLKWVNSNTNNNSQAFLPDGYNWKTYGKLNIVFWEKHQKTSYKDATKMVMGSHKLVIEVLGEFTDEELFTKKHYNWTGSTSLGSYCVSSTSSHYDWAIKKIHKHIKSI